MHFVNPYFLFGLFALTIPIIVHLFNFRKYKLFYFSNTRFLEELQQKTHKQSQIRKLIILSLRLLAITALVFAFARPYIPSKESQTENVGASCVVVYVDNSFSMENDAKKGNLLHEAKEKAAAIADAYRESDKYMLITNDMEAQSHQFLSRDDFKQALEKVEISSASQTIGQIYAYGLRDMNRQNTDNKFFYFISDFQQSTSDFASIQQDKATETYLIPLEANKINNIYIDTLWLNSPAPRFGQQASIHVIVRNTSDNDVEKLPVKLFINNSQKALSSVDVAAGGYAETQLNFIIGNEFIQNGYVEILDNPVIFDDKLYFSLSATAQSKVLSLYDNMENRYLKALFAADSSIFYQSVPVKNINYSSLNEQDLIIVEQPQEEMSNGLIQELSQYVRQGGNLLLFPSSQATNYNNGLNNALGISAFGKLNTEKTAISKLNLEHRLYKNVFEKYPDNINLPVVFQHFESSVAITGNKEVAITLENGQDFLISHKIENGNVYLLAVALNEKFSDFQQHAIFVPTLFNMSLSDNSQNNLYYIIGQANNIILKNKNIAGDNVLEVKNKNQSFIPELARNILGTQLYTHNQVKDADNYLLYDKDTALMGLSFNYSRKESVMDFFSINQIKEQIAQQGLNSFTILDIQHKSSEIIQHQINNFGTSLYFFFILLALLALLAEVILLRIWK